MMQNLKFLSIWLFVGLTLPAAIASAQEAGATSPGEVKIFGGIEFVWIPPGTFTMGTTLSAFEVAAKYRGYVVAYEDAFPTHRVTLSKGFWMSKYEVTNGQYRRFRPTHDSKDFKGHSLNGDRQPVLKVHWKDAEAFCAWLSDKAGGVFALPTEAQWEYACRAGTETVRYWGDDDASESHLVNDASIAEFENVFDRTGKAVFGGSEDHFYFTAQTTDGYTVTAPVGSFKPNPWGLHDMLGNAVEWCSDWYDEDYYKKSPLVDPTGPSTGRFRVLRGGAWNNAPGNARSAFRTWIGPDVAPGGRGFRVCRR